MIEMDGESDTEQFSDDDRPISRARRHSGKRYSEHSANPKKLGFYPPQWRDVLENAKLRWRLWMAVVCGFPNNGNQSYHEKTKECIRDALAEHQKNGGKVEKGRYAYHLDRAISK